jgi:hypothetical protein
MSIPLPNGQTEAPQTPTPPQPSAPIAIIETWLWRFGALACWYWVVSAIVHHASGHDLLRFSNWLLIIPVLAFFSSSVIRSPGYSIGFFFYVPGIAFVAPYWFVRRVLKIKVIAAPATHLITAVCLLVLIPIIWFCLANAETPYIVNMFVALLIFLNTLFLLASLRWASNPFQPFGSIAVFLEWVQNKAPNLFVPDPGLPTERQQATAQGNLTNVRFAKKVVLRLKEIVENLNRWTLVPLSICVFGLMFSVTILSYGFAVYAAQNAYPKPFENLDPSFGHCLVYAISVLMTASIANVNPSSDLAYLIYGAELVSTFLILSLFFSTFSAAVSIARHRVQEVDATFERILEKLNIDEIKNQTLLNGAQPTISPSLAQTSPLGSLPPQSSSTSA